jgi:hypothetical protein
MAGWESNRAERTKKAAKKEKRMKQVNVTKLPTTTMEGKPSINTPKAATPYQSTYYGAGTYYSRPVVPTPTDTKDTSKLSIVLMRQSVLNAISAICQPVAGASEFQVHYRALVVRVKSATNELIISIPTAYYNFKQKVATASVDYHLDDIDREAEAVKPISDLVIKEIFKDMPILAALKDLYDGVAEVTYSEVNSGSIHRHPGRFGFSVTDYTKTPSNPGVIYREALATDKVHTDSVIYLGSRTEIYTTETRILNIAPKDNGVEGTYCQLPTTTYLLNDVPATGTDSQEHATINSLAELLGGLEESVKDPSGEYYVTNAMGAINGYALCTEIINSFKASSFEQDITNVVSSHITSNAFSYAYKGAGHVIGGAVKKSEGLSAAYQNYLDYDFDDDYLDDGIYGGHWRGGHYVPNSKPKATPQTPAEKPASAVAVAINPYPVGTPYWAEYNLRHGTK